MWKKFLNLFKSKKNNGGEIYISDSSYDEMNQDYLFDFRNYNTSWSGGLSFTDDSMGASSESNEESDISMMLSIRPKQVVDEIEQVPNKINLMGLDKKIALLKRKKELIRQKYSKREVEGLIERLGYRTKWNDHKEFFLELPVTSDEKIEKFLQKYSHLRLGNTELFVPEFPEEAITIMEQYNEKVKEITGQKAVFYIIAREQDFDKAEKNRDPILLAQSPFAFNWYILGAWDEELQNVHEL